MNNQVHESRFCQGLQYKITKFWLVNNCQSHVIVPGPFIYLFDEETEFQYVPELHPTLPLYWFSFIDIGMLRTKVGDKTNMLRKFYFYMHLLFVSIKKHKFETYLLIIFARCNWPCYWNKSNNRD